MAKNCLIKRVFLCVYHHVLKLQSFQAVTSTKNKKPTAADVDTFNYVLNFCGEILQPTNHHFPNTQQNLPKHWYKVLWLK